MDIDSQALWLTLFGFLIVFAALATIALAVFIVRRFDARWLTAEAEDREAQAAKQPTIDTTTVVLISAAVATVLGGRARIRRIHRLPSQSQGALWSQQGRLVLQGSHAFVRKTPGNGR